MWWVSAPPIPIQPLAAEDQVPSTLRGRSEEPGSPAETQEKMGRMVAAMLLCSVPAPSPRESRYLSRIFPGNAVTV